MEEQVVEKKKRDTSGRKVVVVYAGADTGAAFNVTEFDTKTKAAEFIHEVGVENVSAVYAGAKKIPLRTRVAL